MMLSLCNHSKDLGEGLIKYGRDSFKSTTVRIYQTRKKLVLDQKHSDYEAWLYFWWWSDLTRSHVLVIDWDLCKTTQEVVELACSEERDVRTLPLLADAFLTCLNRKWECSLNRDFVLRRGERKYQDSCTIICQYRLLRVSVVRPGSSLPHPIELNDHPRFRRLHSTKNKPIGKFIYDLITFLSIVIVIQGIFLNIYCILLFLWTSCCVSKIFPRANNCPGRSLFAFANHHDLDRIEIWAACYHNHKSASIVRIGSLSHYYTPE